MNRQYFKEGFKDGIPVGLGYFVVAFSLGITARSLGFNWIQAAIMSLTNIASAGEYAGLKVISEKGSYFQIALMMLVANCRYMLMSTALSQKISPDMKGIHRFTISSFVTDELFALAATRKGDLCPAYSYGTYFSSIPAWTVGTAIGVIAGNILPEAVTNALGVALFGMFIAIIVPPAKKNKIIAGIIVVCFALSYACGVIPYVRDLSSGSRTIVLTVVISLIAAALFPVNDDEEADKDEEGKKGEK